MRLVATVAGVAAAALLAGCSDDGGSSETEDYQSRLEAYRALNDRVGALDDARYTRVQDATGSATYEGPLALGDVAVGGGTSIIGDARIVADFDSDRLRGSADDFFGRFGGGGIEDFEGQLTLENGRIGVSEPNAVSASVTGTLVGEGGDRVEVVDADMTGNIKTGLRALDMVDPAALVIVNGKPELYQVVVAAER